MIEDLQSKTIAVKICGMKQPENILEIASLQPAYLGFIFAKKSPRYFEETIPSLPKAIKKVGVFVEESIENIVLTVFNCTETNRQFSVKNSKNNWRRIFKSSKSSLWELILILKF